MALTPEIDIGSDIDEIEETETTEPLLTYKIDFENKRLTGELINGIEAIRQFVYLALRTPRYAYAIYSDEYGSEIEELLSDSEVTTEFKKMELPRLIEEALIYDDRISEVNNFEIKHIADQFHIKFTVVSNVGVLEMEEVF
jgi:phage baseplate assembly protein W